jgi:hypothetical protein
MRQLVKDDVERFTLSGDPALLHQALEIDLEAPDRLDSLRAALKLAAALDGELRSPTAAAMIRAVLRANNHAVRLLESTVLDEQPIDRKRSFAKSEGRDVVLDAPVFGSGAPESAIPLKDMLKTMKPVRPKGA